jgi:hypothetical protein
MFIVIALVMTIYNSRCASDVIEDPRVIIIYLLIFSSQFC